MNSLWNRDLTCPVCGQLDAVQKVSVVVDAGTSRTTCEWPTWNLGLDLEGEWALVPGWTSTTTTSQSSLSTQLALPPPIYMSPWLEFPAMYSLLLCAFALAGLVGFWGLILAPQTYWQFCGGWWLGIGIMVGVVAVLKAHEAARRHQQVSESLPAWQQARWRWHQLYFCHRCAGVYLPGGRSDVIPVAEVRAFCYDPLRPI